MRNGYQDHHWRASVEVPLFLAGEAGVLCRDVGFGAIDRLKVVEHVADRIHRAAHVVLVGVLSETPCEFMQRRADGLAGLVYGGV
ncbi:MAG: hypothetical protein EBR82_87610 [Caulobacteraceae bacterium]|nr:hypothetical protein [Caulobacteraceae bacterium]